MRNKPAYNTIKDMVELGFTLSDTNPDLSNDEFNLWFTYSSNVLDGLSRSLTPSIYNNYLRLRLMIPNATAPQKLNACLVYLAAVMDEL